MISIRELLEYVATRYDQKIEDDQPELKARLIWRDEHGGISQEKMASFGFCSGLYPHLTVEMNTAQAVKDDFV